MVYEVAQEYSDALNKPRSDGENCRTRVQVAGVIIIAFSVFLWFLLAGGWAYPYFSMAVSSIEGLSPSSQTSATISPVFTLTLHVDNSRDSLFGQCFIKGETRVFYQLVQIAAAPIGEFCVDPSGKKDMTIRAWSLDLQLPAFLRDQLYEETMNRKAIFDVQLRLDTDNPDHTLNMWLFHFFVPLRGMMLPGGDAAQSAVVGIAGNEAKITEKGVITTETMKAV